MVSQEAAEEEVVVPLECASGGGRTLWGYALQILGPAVEVVAAQAAQVSAAAVEAQGEAPSRSLSSSVERGHRIFRASPV